MSQDPHPARDSAYHAARAAEERRLAMAAGDPNVRAIHLEMAVKYEQLAQAAGFAPEPVGEQRSA